MNDQLNSSALRPNTSWNGPAFVRAPALPMWAFWSIIAPVAMYLLSQHWPAPIEQPSSLFVAIGAPAVPADASLPDAGEALRGRSAWEAEIPPTF